ncbi:DUF445 domain-containing protein [Paenibacillus pinisoli]|uniref:DUF445 domain-containing protein n=1 Tax=Paenibacillus pinisoli TaxID=1276110 RepID=A0A3A6PSS9_9BACL|nr:DUF445 domain-containing protein [Paenibacillus pinisoli]RJX41329.1 DUF445 domain-containing protein [Paenibacillus pinisoli]
MTMRRKANLSLLLLALLFIGAAALMYWYPGRWWSKLLLYSAEAGLVGALADLFAVTVLFRHPLGMRWVPHTAIIPRNRTKLVEGVAAMVEEQLLSKSMIKDKLMAYSIVDAIIGWVDRKGRGGMGIAEKGWELLLSWVKGTDTVKLASKLDGYVRGKLRGMDLSRYGGRGLRWLLVNSDFQKWMGQVVDYAAKRVASEDTKGAIRAMLAKEKDNFVSEGGSFTKWLKRKLVDFAEAADALNLDDAANTLYNDLQSFMNDLKDPKHELRVLVEVRLMELAEKLETSEDMAATIEKWKLELLDELSLQPSIHALLDSMRGMLLAGSELKYLAAEERQLHVDDVKNWLSELIGAYWEAFKADEEIKAQLDGYLKQFINGIMEQEHALIGRIARKTLEGFTEERLVEFIESKVETDLQRIRLNGAFIGAGVGALIFVFLNGVYGPLLEYLF